MTAGAGSHRAQRVQRARPGERGVRRPRSRRHPLLLRCATADLLALAGLGVALLGLLAYVALVPPTAFDLTFGQPGSPVRVRTADEIPRQEVLAFTVDRPPQVILHDFYGLERNAAGVSYRWTKPTATLTVPISAPADYRLTLTMQDGADLSAPRAVALRVNDGPAQIVRLTRGLHEYSVDYRADHAAWGAGGQPTLTLELATTPYLPPADRRELGVVVSGLAIAPIRTPTPWQPALLVPNLVLLAAAYGVVRGAGGRVAAAAGLCAALLAAFALLALFARAAALLLAYQPATHPVWLLGLLLGHGAALAVARAVLGRPVADPPPAPPAQGGGAVGTGGVAPWIGEALRRCRAAPGIAWRARRAVLAGGLGEALWLFVTLRLAFSLVALLASWLAPPADPCTWRGEEPMPATGLEGHLLGVWQRADACWYEKVAALGYRPGDRSVVFFPLYPLLMRAASLPFGGALSLAPSLIVGGLIISGLAFIAAVTGVYRLTCRDFDAGVARRAVLYLSVFPSAFFFFAPYTEALFLALAVWTLYLARRGAWGGAGAAAFLASLTRTQGCFLALPLAWELFRQWRDPQGARRPTGPALLVPLLPLHGLLAFLAYSHTFIGWTTFPAQQEGWGYTLRLPWTLLALSWRHVVREAHALEALNLGLLLLVGALLLYGLRRLPFAYTLYAAPHLLLMMTRQPFASPLSSASRYVLVLFPAFIALALLGRHRRLHYSWLLLSTLLLAFLLYAFVTRAFVA